MENNKEINCDKENILKDINNIKIDLGIINQKVLTLENKVDKNDIIVSKIRDDLTSISKGIADLFNKLTSFNTLHKNEKKNIDISIQKITKKLDSLTEKSIAAAQLHNDIKYIQKSVSNLKDDLKELSCNLAGLCEKQTTLRTEHDLQVCGLPALKEEVEKLKKQGYGLKGIYIFIGFIGGLIGILVGIFTILKILNIL
jgi:chromosome segregation ATPase